MIHGRPTGAPIPQVLCHGQVAVVPRSCFALLRVREASNGYVLDVGWVTRMLTDVIRVLAQM